MTIFFDPLHSPTGGVCRNVILRSDRDEKDTKAAMGLVMDGSFILASASPRRIELLKGFGLSFDVIPSGADESFRPGETPRDHVRRISGAKALAVAADHPDAWVLGADTIVVIDGRVLGKPKDKEDARNMLRLLSGQEHSVYTGFSIVGKAKALLRQRVIRSVVVFKRISEDELEWYVNSDEPYDKAGGYAVQEKGGLFARRIRGSYSNVIGLPVSEVFEVLKEIGAIRFNGVCHEQFG